MSRSSSGPPPRRSEASPTTQNISGTSLSTQLLAVGCRAIDAKQPPRMSPKAGGMSIDFSEESFERNGGFGRGYCSGLASPESLALLSPRLTGVKRDATAQSRRVSPKGGGLSVDFSEGSFERNGGYGRGYCSGLASPEGLALPSPRLTGVKRDAKVAPAKGWDMRLLARPAFSTTVLCEAAGRSTEPRAAAAVSSCMSPPGTPYRRSWQRTPPSSPSMWAIARTPQGDAPPIFQLAATPRQRRASK